MYPYGSLIIFILLLLTGCGHHRDVRPGENGIHRVVVRAEDHESGEQDAIAQANHYCDKYGKEAIFINENSKYSGDVSEGTYKAGKAMSKVAQLGGAAYGLHSTKNSSVGEASFLGGSVASSVLGKGYTTEMQFKCQ